MSVLKSTAGVALLTACSRVLGFVREMFQSRLIGAGVEQSAFAVAFALPNMARRLFGEGALTSAFVPIFSGELEADASLERARRLARAVLTMSLAMVSALALLAWILTTGALAYVPSLSPKLAFTLSDARILLPYMVFICGAAFGMGVLNSFGRFAFAALMPSILNIIWIAALATLFLFPGWVVQTRVTLVCSAILFAGVLQMAFMFRAMAKKGIRPRLTLIGWHDANTRLVWKNMMIACVGSGAVQINYMCDQMLSLKASDWAAGVLGYADRLMELPLGVVGTAFGTVLLTAFSKAFAKNDVAAVRRHFTLSARNMMLLVIPSAMALIILAPEMTRLVYCGGKFDELAVTRVARAVACYSAGLIFFCLQKILTPWFQAQKDQRTPTRIAAWMVCLNFSLNLMAVFGLPVEWRHVGLAASTVLCSGLSCLWLARIASSHAAAPDWSGIFRAVVPMFLAAFVMGGVLWILKDMLSDWRETIPLRVAAMSIFIVAGSGIYFAVYGVLHVAGRAMLRSRQ